MMPPASTMETMAKDGIAISQQPNFSYTLEGRYTETLDDVRHARMNSVATPLKYGIAVAFASDNLPIGPMVAIYEAVHAQGHVGQGVGTRRGRLPPEAIRLYTAAGPYLSFEENKKGALEVGKFADMIVMEADPLTVPAEQLRTLKVDQTYVAGKLLYDRSKAAPGS